MTHVSSAGKNSEVYSKSTTTYVLAKRNVDTDLQIEEDLPSKSVDEDDEAAAS
jgi:hypothetical protein